MRRTMNREKNEEVPPLEAEKEPVARDEADLTPLFRLLMRQPPKDHHFETCPICNRYGIREI